MHVQEDDWVVIRHAVEEIESILREAGDPGADQLALLRTDWERSGRRTAIETLGSGDMWGHMGSFFDRSLSDRALDRKFRRAQIRLADALEAAGATSPDMRAHTSILRTWESQGL